MNKQDIDYHIQDLLDGTIQAPQLAALETELRVNVSACARYTELVHIHNALQLRSSACKKMANNVVPMDQVLLKQKRKSIKVAAFAAAAVILITFLSMQLFVHTDASTQALSFTASPETQFSITHSDAEKSDSGQTLAVGSRLQLRQGSLELNFGSGVKSVIIAPADITLQDDNTLAMKEGRGWFTVPEKAIGFRVITKQLDIVDLGTEFGILSGADVADEIHVFKGAVTAAAANGDGPTITLRQSEARRISPSGSLEPIPASPENFLNTLPESLPHIRWTFDGNDPFQATGSHPDVASIHTSLHGSPEIVAGRFGNAVKLNGIDQYLESNWKGFSGMRPRTVSAWVKIDSDDSLDNNADLIGWGKKYSANGKWTMNISKSASPRHLRLSLGNSSVTSRKVVPADRWVHLVIATKGKPEIGEKMSVDLYVDGKLETKMVHKNYSKTKGTATDDKISVPLLIGSSVHFRKSARKFLKAEIDEITIYDGYLDPDNALQLAD